MRWLGHLCHHYPRFWAGVERLETSMLRDQIAQIAIDRPIYVTGLARSGTTILLELLASLPSVASHRYRDFPPIWTPYLWNRFLELVPNRAVEPRERPHGDGIEITPESPEALEEPIWMRFFPHLHEAGPMNRLDRSTRNDRFSDFYKRHIRKLLLVRGGGRYLAKGNYNIARLGYLQELFPDARFVIPVRHPIGHVASLMRQHRIFSTGQQAHPEARDYLRQVGHFEFGLDRAPIDMGGAPAIPEILARWKAGEEAAGWAAYWSHVYSAVHDQLDRDARLRQAVLVVRHEDLNDRPDDELRRVMEHCGLEVDAPTLAKMTARLGRRDYGGSPFDPADERTVLQVAARTMVRFGYANLQP